MDQDGRFFAAALVPGHDVHAWYQVGVGQVARDPAIAVRVDRAGYRAKEFMASFVVEYRVGHLSARGKAPDLDPVMLVADLDARVDLLPAEPGTVPIFVALLCVAAGAVHDVNGVLLVLPRTRISKVRDPVSVYCHQVTVSTILVVTGPDVDRAPGFRGAPNDIVVGIDLDDSQVGDSVLLGRGPIAEGDQVFGLQVEQAVETEFHVGPTGIPLCDAYRLRSGVVRVVACVGIVDCQSHTGALRPFPTVHPILVGTRGKGRIGQVPRDLSAVAIFVPLGRITPGAWLDIPGILLPILIAWNAKVRRPQPFVDGLLAVGTAPLITDPYLDWKASIRGAGDGVGSGIHHGDRQVGDDVGLGAVAIADRDCLSGLEIEATEVQVKVAPLVGVSSSVVAIYRDVHRAVGLPFPA